MSDQALSLEAIMRLAEHSAQVTAPCACARRPIPGWESQSSSFPEELLDPVGAVAPPARHGDPNPTVREYHPAGTDYWSPEAPLALYWFPFNRSTLWQCRQCGRAYARYTEYGGYYVDRRIRSLQPERITDEAGPDAEP